MKEDIYISLIYKALKGEITLAEQSSLDTETDLSIQKQQLRNEIEDAWFSSSTLPDLDIDVEADLKALHPKLEKAHSSTPKTTKPANNFRIFRRLAIAACTLMIAAVGFWTLSNNGSEAVYVSLENPTTHTLADGSKIVLNKNSQLTVSKDFGKENRSVNLSGEAYFNVAKDAQSPFVITANQTKVTVLGTSFNVKSTPQYCKVAVNTGKVSVQTSNNSVELIANELAIHNLNDNSLNKENLNTQNFSFYKNKSIVFKDTPVRDALKQLQLIFDSDINLQNTDLNSCRISLVTNKNTIEQVLEKLSLTLNTKVNKIDNQTYILEAGSCQ